MSDKSYWKPIGEAIGTSLKGASITFKHLKNAVKNKKRGSEGPSDDNYFEHTEGIFTLKYPREVLPTPVNGRYKLHNEIDDCIVCDKCAKICPVDCIDIEPIKSTETIGLTSDGTAKRLYAAKFDIDMAKCCFCGLCTTVCPTECLTMTPDYDFSTFEIGEMNFEFSEMTEAEVSEKKELYEAQQKAKKEAALKAKQEAKDKPTPKPSIKRPAIKAKPSDDSAEQKENKPTFRPRPAIKRPVVKTKPVIKPKDGEKADSNSAEQEVKKTKKSRPVFKKPIIEDKSNTDSNEDNLNSIDEVQKPKPKRPRPVFKKPLAEDKPNPDIIKEKKTDSVDEVKPKPKRPRPVFKKPSTDDKPKTDNDSSKDV